MNKLYIKIFSIVLFVVLGIHFFHSEFDLFSCESTSEHHASHDYCQLVDSVVFSKGHILAVKNIISDYHPGPLFLHYEYDIKLTADNTITQIFIPKDCPHYLWNRIILI